MVQPSQVKVGKRGEPSVERGEPSPKRMRIPWGTKKVDIMCFAKPMWVFPKIGVVLPPQIMDFSRDSPL